MFPLLCTTRLHFENHALSDKRGWKKQSYLALLSYTVSKFTITGHIPKYTGSYVKVSSLTGNMIKKVKPGNIELMTPSSVIMRVFPLAYTLDFYTQDGQALVRQEPEDSLLFFYVKWKKGYFEFKSILGQIILKKHCHWWIWKLIPLKLSRIRIKAPLKCPLLSARGHPSRKWSPHRTRAESRAMCPESLCFLGAQGFRSLQLLFLSSHRRVFSLLK